MIVRLDGVNTPCPFHGAFSFHYKEGGRECAAPKSYISQCVEQSRLLFRFGVCPDSVQTENSGNIFYETFISIKGDPEETLSCKATWTPDDDPSETYMIGTLDYRYKRTDEERVRCFRVKNLLRHIQVAQSSNSSCYADLHDSKVGYRTMELKREEVKSGPSCTYPDWAVQLGALYSFSFSSRYEFTENGTELLFSDHSSSSNRSSEVSRTRCISVEEEEEEEYVKLVVETVAGCHQMFKCLAIFKRTDSILEIQEGSPTIYQEAACTDPNFDQHRTKYSTLFREGLYQVDCPINGLHNVTGMYLMGKTEPCDNQSFSNINIRCGEQEHFIQFYQECPSNDGLSMVEGPRSNYLCLGGWETVLPISLITQQNNRLFSELNPRLGEAGLFTSDEQVPDTNITFGFLVAAQELEPGKRICFMYTKAGGSYSWTVDKTACLRNIRPGWEGRMRFNTTVLETCGTNTVQIFNILLIVLGTSHVLRLQNNL